MADIKILYYITLQNYSIACLYLFFYKIYQSNTQSIYVKTNQTKCDIKLNKKPSKTHCTQLYFSDCKYI